MVFRREANMTPTPDPIPPSVKADAGLLPCKKCGSGKHDFARYGKDRDKAEMIAVDGVGGVEVQMNWMVYICMSCGFTCESANTVEDTMANWNLRAPYTTGQVEALRKAQAVLKAHGYLNSRSVWRVGDIPDEQAEKLRTAFPAAFQDKGAET